ncbi:MAG: hypothetical protein WCK26_02205 [Candidatus Saccharibacteria bacterium]
MKKYALISVYNKDNLSDLAHALVENNYTIIATDGTGRELNKYGVEFTPANKVTNNPNILKDCIQTISFNIESGILFNRDDTTHTKDIERYNIKSIDIVVCNFAKINETVLKIDDFSIKNVDLGGPLMIKAAAINYKYTIPVVDPADYNIVIDILKNGATLDQRISFAKKAFNFISDYDKGLSQYLNSVLSA